MDGFWNKQTNRRRFINIPLWQVEYIFAEDFWSIWLHKMFFHNLIRLYMVPQCFYFSLNLPVKSMNEKPMNTFFCISACEYKRHNKDIQYTHSIVCWNKTIKRMQTIWWERQKKNEQKIFKMVEKVWKPAGQSISKLCFTERCDHRTWEWKKTTSNRKSSWKN